jgi:hypothetical protein
MEAADFKARCLEVIETVRRTQRSVTIIRNGVPIVTVVATDAPKKLVLGALQGRFSSADDIVSSPLSDDEWKALDRERTSRWKRLLGGSIPGRRRRRVARR